MTYTDKEIEAAARAYAKFHGIDDDAMTKAGFQIGREKLAAMHAALSAVPRVPANCWIAPDIISNEMIEAANDAWDKWQDRKGYKAGYEAFEEMWDAMRDVVKGRKP